MDHPYHFDLRNSASRLKLDIAKLDLKHNFENPFHFQNTYCAACTPVRTCMLLQFLRKTRHFKSQNILGHSLRMLSFQYFMITTHIVQPVHL